MEINILLEIFKMVLCKEMGFGKIKKDKSLLDAGEIIKLMVMEYIQLNKVIIKVNLLIL